MDIDFKNMRSGCESSFHILPLNQSEYSHELGTYEQNRGQYKNDYSDQDNNFMMQFPNQAPMRDATYL